jgi:hypothetical protein
VRLPRLNDRAWQQQDGKAPAMWRFPLLFKIDHLGVRGCDGSDFVNPTTTIQANKL